MTGRSKVLVCLLLAALVLIALVPASAREQETAQKSRQLEDMMEKQGRIAQEETAEQSGIAEETEKEIRAAVEEIPEVIVPAPKDQKEAVAIYVFLAWMWLSIVVLLYVLRLKVREVDRIHQLKFFSGEKE